MYFHKYEHKHTNFGIIFKITIQNDSTDEKEWLIYHN